MAAGTMAQTLDLDRVRQRLRCAMSLRAKYTPCTVPEPVPEAARAVSSSVKDIRYEFRKGVMHVFRTGSDEKLFAPRPDIEEFYNDMAEIFAVRTDGSMGSFCFQRLRLLQTKFELYNMSSFDVELGEQMSNPHRDFYNVRKVDTHIHHSAAMNAKHLLRFIKKKLKAHGDDVVGMRNGQEQKLKDVFAEHGISWEHLSLDKLNCTADVTVFHRFDRFNEKYNPLNQPQLRTIFLKTENDIKGRYLAELTRELLNDLEESKYQHTEWRLSVYGRKRDEWHKLSKWVLDNNLISPNNRWMIQVPRLYSVYFSAGQISNFQEMLNNIFLPMFEATLNPDSHPEIAQFLALISGFDSVDDESKSTLPKERTFSSRDRPPEHWDISDNPSYKYYNYFIQTNLCVLNQLRSALGLNQFNYRPHAGEAGELHHLDTAFLLADSIAHGINLRKSLPLQYLFYLCEIGIAMSPCSNNHLFLSYQKSPFYEFFTRGLNLSLSTDDPLMFHQTREPLMEEYSLAKQFFRLSSADMCELARNSVLQSGFSSESKASWLGSANPRVNDIKKTNVPKTRLQYRTSCHDEEMNLLNAVENSWGAFVAGIPGQPQREDTTNGQMKSPAPSWIRSHSPKATPLLIPVAPEDSNYEDGYEMPPAALQSPMTRQNSEDASPVRTPSRFSRRCSEFGIEEEDFSIPSGKDDGEDAPERPHKIPRVDQL